MLTATRLRYHFERLLDSLSPRRRLLQRLRAKWGQPGTKEGFASCRYFDLALDPAECSVDDRTWIDLELPKVFSVLDSTESPVGSQYLYRRLRTYVDSPMQLAQYHATCQALRADVATREKIQLELSGLQEDEASAQLADTIFGQAPVLNPAMRLLPWWSLACLTALVLVVVTNLSVWVWLATLGINLLLIVRFNLPLHRELYGLRGCHRMLCVADGLARVPAGENAPAELTALREQAPQRARARARLGWVLVLQGPGIQHLAVWLNWAFLAEWVAFVYTVGRLNGIRAELASTFALIGSLDASIAVASYLEAHPDHCTPMLGECRTLELVDGQHPLIADPVRNSFRLAARSALVTGSNMAGKTTFIKMVGLNVIFGRTLGFCLATRAALPTTGVMASIRGEHSVESGKSHYFSEMEAIQSFMEHAQRGECRLFLVDELFSGTNTIERLAAGRAVLESLGKSSQVLVTTHDIELQEDLAPHYDLYYFQEHPDVEGYFDYRLRRGRTTQRNAIRLLERRGFPADIVASALAYSEHYARMTGSVDGAQCMSHSAGDASDPTSSQNP